MNKSSVFFPITSIYNKTDKKIYSSGQNFLAYETFGENLVLAGDPKADSLEQQVNLYNEFVNLKENKNKRICGYYFSEEFSRSVSGTFEVKRFQMGTSSFIFLEDYDLKGNSFKEVRRAINHAESKGLVFKELSNKKTDNLNAIKELNVNWEASKKKKHLFKRIKFLLSKPSVDFYDSKHERWFSVWNKNNLDAFVSFLPYSDNKRHYYMDNMLQSPTGDKFAMDYLLSQVILKLKEEKALEICLGFNIARGLENNTLVEKLFSLMFKTSIFYNAKGLGYFKNKFNTIEKNRYFIYSKNQLVWSALRAAYKVTFK